MGFEKQLSFGRVAEGLIAKWLMSRGSIIMPAYEIEIPRGKGPQLFGVDHQLVAPDLLAFNHAGIRWVESKHKSVFSWHRISRKWTTGIDLRHYVDYLRVSKETKIPVWLLFFHRHSKPDQRDLQQGSPAECPVGLFGEELFSLVASENHRTPAFDASRTGMTGHGKSGMVYWAVDDLRLLAPLNDVLSQDPNCLPLAANE